MTDSKKPPRAPIKRTTSGQFEFPRPSLSPGPALRLPPSMANESIVGMAPLKIPAEDARPAPASGEAPVASLSAIPGPPVRAPEIVIVDAPPAEASLPPPRSLSPPSLPQPHAPAGSRRVLLVVLAAALLAVALLVRRLQPHEAARATVAEPSHAGAFSAPFDVRTFQRGNIHTHTLRSDGRQSPEEVARWYRDHGYQFLAITDHDVFVAPGEIHDVETPAFVLVPGEEITSSAGDKPVHLLALCIHHRIASALYGSPLDALSQGIAAVRDQNGFVVVNHPNFFWALGLADIMPLTGSYGLEIWSGHPASNSAGDATRPSHQAIWDELLTRDRRVTAVAVDDEHTLYAAVDGGEGVLPGRAWIQTFGELGRAPICDALKHGRLYASSGVSFRRIRLEPRRFTVWVDDPDDTVEFIASAAHVLASVAGDALLRDRDGFAASYALSGGEAFVRAVARAPDGSAAWTQAYYTTP